MLFISFSESVVLVNTFVHCVTLLFCLLTSNQLAAGFIFNCLFIIFLLFKTLLARKKSRSLLLVCGAAV